jgi:hypothetical protein
MLGWGQRPGVAARPRGPIPSRSRITPVTSSRRNGQLRIGGAPMHAVGPLQGKSPIEPQTSEIQTPSAIAAPNDSAPKTTIAGRTLVEVVHPKYRVGKPSIAAGQGTEAGSSVVAGTRDTGHGPARRLSGSRVGHGPPNLADASKRGSVAPRRLRSRVLLLWTAGVGTSEDGAASSGGRAPSPNGKDGPAPRNLMEYDTFTTALRCANPAAPNLDKPSRTPRTPSRTLVRTTWPE